MYLFLRHPILLRVPVSWLSSPYTAFMSNYTKLLFMTRISTIIVYIIAVLMLWVNVYYYNAKIATKDVDDIFSRITKDGSMFV